MLIHTWGWCWLPVDWEKSCEQKWPLYWGKWQIEHLSPGLGLSPEDKEVFAKHNCKVKVKSFKESMLIN